MEEVCKLTLQNVLGVSSNRIRNTQERISTGRLQVYDRRGTHGNHPHAVPQDVRDDIIAHINSFPSELSHYTRNVSET